MEKNLAIDIGNSRLKYGFFKGDNLEHNGSSEEDSVDSILEIAKEFEVVNVIVSSTRDLPSELDDALKSRFRYVRLTHETPIPVNLDYKTPDTLGKDRVAAIVGAYYLFPGRNCLVVDAGTCITYDVLDKTGTFRGGNIAPGIVMRLKAMHHFTAKLPLVNRPNSFEISQQWLGRSTNEAIRNGAEWGAILELQAFIEKTRKEFSPLTIILTGGDAEFFVKTLKTKIFVRPNLVLYGLNKILTYNVN